ncbi:MAG: response regulator [Polaromonas sp.]
MSEAVAKLGLVLCVDDEPGILRSLQWLLKKEFDVKIATSGHEALEMLRHHDFDVILSDQRMPGMMGSQFLHEARKISPRSMRILLTGYSDLQAILHSVNDGEVFRFVNKPWNIKELPKIISDAAIISKNQPSEAASSENDNGDEINTGDESILLIDDDPLMDQLVLDAVGADVKIVHATTLAEAIAAVEDKNVGIILSDTKVDKLDTTTMLKVMKHDHPDIVTVVYSATTDAIDVITLINQGQIFRFIPKPVKTVMLKQALMRAAVKRRELRGSPDAAKRHMVESISEKAKVDLYKTIQSSASNVVTTPASSLLQRIRNAFRALLGRG